MKNIVKYLFFCMTKRGKYTSLKKVMVIVFYNISFTKRLHPNLFPIILLCNLAILYAKALSKNSIFTFTEPRSKNLLNP